MRDPYDTGRAKAWVQWCAPNLTVDEVNSPIGALGAPIGAPEAVQIRTVFGRDMAVSDRLMNEATDEIIARYRPDVEAGWAAVDMVNGAVYHVLFTDNVEQRNKTLRIWVKKRTA